MIYTYRKAILVILALLVLGGTGIGIYSYLQHSKAQKETKQEIKKEPIKGVDSLSISSDIKDAINRYATGTLTAVYGKGTYDISVRDNSYQRSVTPEGSVVTEVLLDVPEKKSTYLYTQVTSGVNPAYGTSYLRCAPESEQLVKPSVCKDVAND